VIDIGKHCSLLRFGTEYVHKKLWVLLSPGFHHSVEENVETCSGPNLIKKCSRNLRVFVINYSDVPGGLSNLV
jgi:hypothetical protein